MRPCCLLVLTASLFAVTLAPLPGADWPAWRGPDRTGISKETGLLATWPEGGPKLVWKTDKAGQGYAGMAIVNGVVYTMGARGDEEYALAYDGKGKELWSTKIGPVHDWGANSWSRGPNATPTVSGDLVYALSSKGVLLCVNKNDGKQVWRLDLAKDLDAEVNPVGGGVEKFGWGYTWSPQVDGDQLIIVPGGPKGLIAGLDLKTGKVRWRSKDFTDQATYASPMVATIGGVRQCLYVTQQTLVSVSTKDGTVLWKHRRDEPYSDVVCATPIVEGDNVIISVGYGGGTERFKVTGSGTSFKVASVWSEKVIANKQSGVVQVGKYLYGYHEDRNWACQDAATGKIAWPTKRTRQSIKAGGMVAAEGRLYVLDETGTIGMLEASPKGYKVISSFKMPEESKNRKPRGGIWTHPSLSDGKLYVRDQELIYCYQVK